MKNQAFTGQSIMIEVNERKRYAMSVLRAKYPDKWVILDDCHWANKSTIESGVLVGVCDDFEIEDIMVKSRNEKKGYMFRRTTEDIFNPFVQSLNYEIWA